MKRMRFLIASHLLSTSVAFKPIFLIFCGEQGRTSYLDKRTTANK